MKRILAILAFALFFYSCKKTETVAPDNSYSGKLASSGAVNFSALCIWSAEYINSTFDIKLDNTNQKVLSATIAATMKEKVLTGGCTPLTQQSPHSYTLAAYSVSGNSLLIYFKQDNSSFPQNIASFTGSITATAITGVLTLFRKSDGIFCKVDMAFQLAKTG